MFNDFLNKDYWKTKHKISVIRELINRFIQLPDIDSISERANRLDEMVQNLGGWINPERRPPLEPPPEPPLPPVPELLPDLIVESIVPENFEHYTNFKITVKNQGLVATTTNTTMIINIQGILSESLPVPELAVGETHVANFQHSYDEFGAEITKTVTATVDPDNAINEINDNNNSNSIQVDMKEQEAILAGFTGLIVHAHNEEGKEIGSILNNIELASSPPNGNPSVTVKDEFDNIINTYGAPYNSSNHGTSVLITSGERTVIVEFNGISIEKNVTLIDGEVNELFFIFERTVVTPTISSSESFLDTLSISNFTGIDIFPPNLHYLSLDETPWQLTIKSNLSPSSTGTIVATGGYNLNNLSFSVNLDFVNDNNSLSRMFLNYAGAPFIPPPNQTQIPNDIIIDIIPSSSDFVFWFSQNNSTGDYPLLQLFSTDTSEYYGVVVTQANNSFLSLSASRSYSKIRSLLGTGLTTKPDTNNVGGDSSLNLSGTLEWTLSSIPLDLEGTAV